VLDRCAKGTLEAPRQVILTTTSDCVDDVQSIHSIDKKQ